MNIKLEGYKEFEALLQNSSGGVILLTAHVGNWQVAMSTLKDFDKTVYLVMHPEENIEVSKALKIDEEQGSVRIISSKQYLGGVIDIINKLREGSIVSLMGDRRYGFKSFDVSFLGDKAWFPYGAFSIAASVECPVVILLSARISDYNYMVNVSNIIYPHYERGENKLEQLREWVQKFAVVLEEHVHTYPYQCFLFHDVWKEDKENN